MCILVYDGYFTKIKICIMFQNYPILKKIYTLADFLNQYFNRQFHHRPLYVDKLYKTNCILFIKATKIKQLF